MSGSSPEGARPAPEALRKEPAHTVGVFVESPPVSEEREQAYQKAKEKEADAFYVAKIWYGQLADFLTRSKFIEGVNKKPSIVIPSILNYMENKTGVDPQILDKLKYFASGARTVTSAEGKTQVIEVERNGYLMLGMQSRGSQGEKHLADIGSARFIRVSEQAADDVERGIEAGAYEMGFLEFMTNYLEVMQLEGAITVQEKEEVFGKIKSVLADSKLVFELKPQVGGDETMGQTKVVGLRLEPVYGREVGSGDELRPLRDLRKSKRSER